MVRGVWFLALAALALLIVVAGIWYGWTRRS
jgi:hypothetical protein